MCDAAGEIAERLHFLRVPQGHLGSFALDGFLLQLQERRAQFVGALLYTLLKGMVEALKLIFRLLLMGDVEAVDENACDRPRPIKYRLVNQIDKSLVRLTVAFALQKYL